MAELFNPDGQISLAGYDFLESSVEVARLWVENGGPATCIIQPERLSEPEMFGMLMVDTVRHAARAYSQCYGMPEGEALERVWAGLDAERDQHTTPLDTLQNYGKTN
jgi:hypothetical protein